MRLEHVAMYVNDLERAKDFFERYFLEAIEIIAGKIHRLTAPTDSTNS